MGKCLNFLFNNMLLTVNATSGADGFVGKSQKVSSVTFVFKKISGEGVIKGATTGSRVRGSRPLIYSIRQKLNFIFGP